jgi:hypothetical protein
VRLVLGYAVVLICLEMMGRRRSGGRLVLAAVVCWLRRVGLHLIRVRRGWGVVLVVLRAVVIAARHAEVLISRPCDFGSAQVVARPCVGALRPKSTAVEQQ